ncbi:hypothetical protein QLS71_005470 [Mariniflexile litorale]|uniref:Uncharacterized protein n=1 Tax=Mariniflexile litorale TaxID=3045158 RepID=A0AAU7EIW8_9FLAO|nr:hypothetical protein [Mariniflexile sp. KMM 9835]MDQ8211025.1 hypothetical protein [Mariniflexile sp. KMM 9835]
MTEKFVFIKEVHLNNNCPICYNSDGLHLTIKQKTVENSFYKAITADIKYDMVCKTCNSTIYPVNWTDDIERVFEYHKKAFTPQTPTTHLKKVSRLAIFSGIIVAICIVAILIYTGL